MLNSNTEGVEDYFEETPVEESLTNTVIRRVAPHMQAVNTVEFVHLLEADQLALANQEEEESATTALEEKLEPQETLNKNQ